MIKNFSDKETEKIYNQQFSRKLPQSIQKIALRKLIMLDNATCINDLRIPPSNHLELLSGNRDGEYSIRINKQYRICFALAGTNDFINVGIEDYHWGDYYDFNPYYFRDIAWRIYDTFRHIYIQTSKGHSCTSITHTGYIERQTKNNSWHFTSSWQIFWHWWKNIFWICRMTSNSETKK